jgi:hypothetical protein
MSLVQDTCVVLNRKLGMYVRGLDRESWTGYSVTGEGKKKQGTWSSICEGSRDFDADGQLFVTDTSHYKRD